MSAYNSKLLVMSAFMLHSCMATFFSNPVHPDTVGYIIKCSDHTEVILAPPWNYLIYCYNMQPLQRIIMESIYFSTAIIFTVLRFVQLWWYLVQNRPDHKLNRHKNNKKTYLIITTAFNSETSIEHLTQRHKCNILSIKFVVDNADNVHIVNRKSVFKDIRPCLERCNTTICGLDSEPEGIGTVIAQITDDNVITSNITIENVLYFPASPVNILSITCLGDYFKGSHDTFIKTTRY